MPRILLFLLFSLSAPLFAEIAPESVAVIYNSSLPESKQLAEAYVRKRSIPTDRLVGLELPDKEVIDRDEFDTLLREPLIREFDRRQWWKRTETSGGKKKLLSANVRVMVCVRGVPLKVYHDDTKPSKPGAGTKPDPQEGLRKMMNTASAAVDSELTLLGIEDATPRGALDNPYYKSTTPIGRSNVPIFLVGRIDAPTYGICHRMIDDALASEKTGLWGFAVVDIANKSDPRDPNGDPWFKSAAEHLHSTGIPVLVDRFDATLPSNFPLPPTALYYGWYSLNVNGPFLNKSFRFKRGAIAVHLHSFSAAQLRKGANNWSAPLLVRGAAATLGNTFEPFLHLTHNLEIFNERLLAGFSLVEAAYMAYPVVSWQGVVIGDPLYRPFLHLDGSGEKQESDRIFRALRIAKLRWPSDSDRKDALKKAAARMQSGLMTEALALDYAESGNPAIATTLLRDATTQYTDRSDQLRSELLVVKLDRERKLRAAALQGLRNAVIRYADLPGRVAAQNWLDTLDPPRKPPSKPGASPKSPKK